MKNFSYHHSSSAKMKNKKFLFISLYDEYALGLRTLASILLSTGYETMLLMLKKFSLSIRTKPTETEWNILFQSVNNYNPDFVGISMLSLSVIDEQMLFKILRSAAPNAVIVCGGFGPTLEPVRFLNFGPDYIVRGEGEVAVLSMADALENGRDFKDISNMAWIENGKLIQNPLTEQIKLEGLPFALHDNRHIIYIDNNGVQNIDPMLDLKGIYLTSTSRGCTSRCTYCAGGNWLDLYRDELRKCNRYRKRPINEVIDECRHAKKIGASFIMFLDEFFVRPQNEYFRFFEMYKSVVNLPFGLMVHTAFMEKDEARFDAFVNAGVHDVEIGVQSASPNVVKNVFNRPVSLDTQLKTINKLYDRWVSVAVDFITGYSLEKEDDFLDTVDFVSKLPFDLLWPRHCYLEVFLLGILPGAKIGDLYPVLKSDQMPVEEKEFRQRILSLRHLLKNDDDFWNIYNNRFFRKKPKLLKNITSIIYSRLNARCWYDILRRLEGKKVYFWGAGQSYQLFKHMFRKTNPQGMIIDKGDIPNKIDGIKVISPEIAFKNKQDKLSIVIFSSSPGIIATNIMCNYPGNYDIIPCYETKFQQLFLA